MNLREQIIEIARVRINLDFARAVAFPAIVGYLAEQAFGHQWPESRETKAIRRAWGLLHNHPWCISKDVPAVGE